jgi:magnesium chelatase family protein
MLGPLGAGMSMLARRLTTSLPAMELANGIETRRFHSVAGLTGETTPPSPSRTWTGHPP